MGINKSTLIQMKNIKNDYCIRMFVGSDSQRPKFMKVNLQDGYLYATNAHIVGKIQADLCVQNYEADEKYPNVEEVFKQHKSTGIKTVSVDTMFNDLMKIECCFKPKMIECDKCNGNGDCVCEHCDSSYKCKECLGTGEVPGKELELSGEHDCILFERKYKLQFLDLIIRTAVYTGVKEIQVSNGQHETSGTLFTVGDFSILLMALAS